MLRRDRNDILSFDGSSILKLVSFLQESRILLIVKYFTDIIFEDSKFDNIGSNI